MFLVLLFLYCVKHFSVGVVRISLVFSSQGIAYGWRIGHLMHQLEYSMYGAQFLGARHDSHSDYSSQTLDVHVVVAVSSVMFKLE
jgi:hypothetical protein